MWSDFAESWLHRPFEGAESKNNIKILSELFLAKKLRFFGGGPPKSDRKLKLSDFDEIWYPGVFEGAESKNNIKILVRTFFGQKT